MISFGCQAQPTGRSIALGSFEHLVLQIIVTLSVAIIACPMAIALAETFAIALIVQRLWTADEFAKKANAVGVNAAAAFPSPQQLHEFRWLDALSEVELRVWCVLNHWMLLTGLFPRLVMQIYLAASTGPLHTGSTRFWQECLFAAACFIQLWMLRCSGLAEAHARATHLAVGACDRSSAAGEI